MISLTIRLIADINESLNRIVQETGIVKASFILYILNQKLNCDSIRVKTSLSFRGQQIVRTTLRLPDALRVKLESAAEESHICFSASYSCSGRRSVIFLLQAPQ